MYEIFQGFTLLLYPFSQYRCTVEVRYRPYLRLHKGRVGSPQLVMGFTPELISTPTVPDGLDPLTYLTFQPPHTKAQETAQLVARKLAITLDPRTLELHNPEIENQNSPAVEYDEATVKFYQNKKTTQFPVKLDEEIEESYIEEYPYFYGLHKQKSVNKLNSIDAPIKSSHEKRQKSVLGQTRAPEVVLSADEFMAGPRLISKLEPLLATNGMVKLIMPDDWRAQPLGFVTDHVPLVPDKKVYVSGQHTQQDELSEYLDEMNLGFTRALVRFHSTVNAANRRLTKLPEYDRRPVDLFRLYCAVARRGGHEEVTKHKEWAQVGRDLGYSSIAGQTLSSNIRTTYTRVIMPFVEWINVQLGGGKSSTETDIDQSRESTAEAVVVENENKANGGETNGHDDHEIDSNENGTNGQSADKDASDTESEDENPSKPVRDGNNTSGEAGGPKIKATDVLFDGRILPRIDVSDYRNAANNKQHWLKLKYDIIIEEPVSSPRKKKGTFVSVKDPATQPSLSFLKQFRKLETRSSRSNPTTDPSFHKIEDLESYYSQLPENFITEQIGMKIYLSETEDDDLKPHENSELPPRSTGLSKKTNAENTASATHLFTDESCWDPWDYMSMSFRNNPLSTIIKGNPGLCTPKLTAGSQFATYNNQKLNGAYTVSIHVQGRGRTWYSKSGTWTDQQSGEIVIVSPGVAYTNWCHGYSAEVSTDFFNPTSWISYAMKNYDKVNKEVCISQTVTDICLSDSEVWVPRKLLLQAGEAIEQLGNEEATYIEKAKSMGIEMESPQPGEMKMCSKTKQFLFLSWIALDDGSVLAPQTFFSTRKSARGVRFQSKLLVNPDSIKMLCESVEKKAGSNASSPEAWLREAAEVITDRSFEYPNEGSFWRLIEHYPSSAATVALALRQILGKFYEAANRMFSDAAAHDQSANTDELRRHILAYNTAFNKLTPALESGNLAETNELLIELEKLDSVLVISTQKNKLAELLVTLLRWCEEASRLAHVNVFTLHMKKFAKAAHRKESHESELTASIYLFKLRSLVAQATKLELSGDLELVKQMKQRLYLAQSGIDSMRALLYSPEVFNSESIRISSLESEDWKPVPAEETEMQMEFHDLFRQFRTVVYNADLIERMSLPVFVHRPKQSETIPLLQANIPEFTKLNDELKQWLVDAAGLDWVAISTQLNLVTQGVPPHGDRMPLRPLSIASIAQVYSRLYTLKIVCDDVENVQATFANTLMVLNNIPIQTLLLYGFTP